MTDIKTVLTDEAIDLLFVKHHCGLTIDRHAFARAIEAAVLAANAPTLPVVEDGENQAIRMFLMRHAGSDAVTTKQMREHLTMAGYEGCWPDWANTDQHLTKAGAQSWIRYLISLERDVLQSLAEETETLGLYDAALQASQSPQDQVKEK